ncbi:uncharacterized protein A4U43_C03F7890 [Asparagus officinalis]|uniref:Uncharacterized protein n=1 Tax=Asparagus officinalis TaxID=4686 RepID=A0A5P1F8Y8_ASPOF|nr:uncharacterized protein A4U43_C03F7890 [Asparagus officinalis]
MLTIRIRTLYNTHRHTYDEVSDFEMELVAVLAVVFGCVLGGGFDLLLLDGMYNQPPNGATMRFFEGAVSTSSVVLPKATSMLALPAPPRASGGGEVAGGDPFAESVWACGLRPLSCPGQAYPGYATDGGHTSETL